MTRLYALPGRCKRPGGTWNLVSLQSVCTGVVAQLPVPSDASGRRGRIPRNLHARRLLPLVETSGKVSVVRVVLDKQVFA